MSYLAQVLYIIDYLTAALDKNLDYIVVILLDYFGSGIYMLFYSLSDFDDSGPCASY